MIRRDFGGTDVRASFGPVGLYISEQMPKLNRGLSKSAQAPVLIGSAGRTRTYDPAVNSRLLYQLS